MLEVMVATAQKNNQIRYILPDQVEVLLDSCINKLKKSETQFYFLLKKDSLYSITIGRYNNKEAKNILKWVKQSNRYIVINAKIYPLIFDHDLKFAAVDNNNIGEFGKREGNIKRANLILHSITIFFKSDGNIIKIEN